MYTHTNPVTRGEKIAIAKARQLTDFEWTPLRDISTYTIKDGYGIIEAGKTVTGFPYSSTEATDKFIGQNVSFETFLSVIPNPESTLYQSGHGALGRCNYGIVCNGFVRYILGIPYRVNTQQWHTLEGMRMVFPKESYKVEDFKLCDILHAFNDGRNHVAMITDIIKDEQGNVVGVEVSEGVAPLSKRETYTPEQYYEKYRPFALWRYDLLEQIPDLDEKDMKVLKNGLEKITPKITVDNGKNSNYYVGEEALISVFEENPDVVEVLKEGKVIQEYRTNGRTFFPCKLSAGYYDVKLKTQGESVSFCVNAPNVRHEVNENTITIYANSNDSKSEILYMDFRMAGKEVAGITSYEILTEEEKKTGVIVRQIPKGAENYKIHFQNPYGTWSHRMIPIYEKRD